MPQLKLAPSILAADFGKLGEQIAAVERAGTSSYVHIDVMDGHFVPNISIGVPVVESLRKWTDLFFDVHLMISEPGKYINAFAEVGADSINVHAEVFKNPEQLSECIDKIHALGKRAAVTLKPQTPVEAVFGIVHKVEMVLLMSVEPGFGGQKFMPKSLEKASALRAFLTRNGLQTDIEMDGGIYLDNVREVINAGVNVVVAGSAVFGAADITAAVQEFYTIFKESGGKR